MTTCTNTANNAGGSSAQAKGDEPEAEGSKTVSPTGRISAPEPEFQTISKTPRRPRNPLVRLREEPADVMLDDAPESRDDMIHDDDPVKPKVPLAEEALRSFAFGQTTDERGRMHDGQYETPEHHLWIIHSFVLGEPVRMKKSIARNAAGKIDRVFYAGSQLVVVVRVLNSLLSFRVTEEEGKLPIYAVGFVPDDEVHHPKFGSGVIVGVAEENVIVKFKKGHARLMKGKKLRRIHVSPKPMI